MPALTSSMCAPAATWASASASTRLKSPAFISSASSLRPVGLIRSPIMTNGRSKPITTSRGRRADDGVGHGCSCSSCSSVSILADVSMRLLRRALRGRRARRSTHAVGPTSASKPPANASRPSRSRVYSRLDRDRQRLGGCREITVARLAARDATARCPRRPCRCRALRLARSMARWNLSDSSTWWRSRPTWPLTWAGMSRQ